MLFQLRKKIIKQAQEDDIGYLNGDEGIIIQEPDENKGEKDKEDNNKTKKNTKKQNK